MSFSLLMAAMLTVAPSDRLALADRLFNRGEYAMAQREYSALKGNAAIDVAELGYRLMECERLLGEREAAMKDAREFLAAHPTSRHAAKVRLTLALMLDGEERVSQLKLLDSDRVPGTIRGEALFRLGEATGETQYYERSVKADPAGRFKAPSQMRYAAALAKSANAEDRRKAIAVFLEVAFGEGSGELSERALYLAAVTSFSMAQYGEAHSLVRRYLKNHPKGANAAGALEMSVWCDYLSGRYTDALASCGEGATEGLRYVKAAATLGLGETEKAKAMLNAYLDEYPTGRYRRDAELSIARIDFGLAEKHGDAVKGIESARRGLVLSGSNADRLRLAWAYEKAGKGEEAIAEYRQIASGAPGSVEAASALFRKAMVELRAEKWSAAELSLEEALKGKLEGSKRADAEYWRGMAALKLGHEAEGVAALKRAIDGGISLDQSREAQLAMADVDFNHGRTNEAISAYAKLVRDGALARMSASKTHKVGRLLEPPEKKLCAEQLVKSGEATWRQVGFALLGDAEERLGNLSAAASAWKSCADEKCETEELARVAVKLGGYLHRNGDYAGAEAILKRAVALNAENNAARAESYLLLAKNAASRNDLESARGYATVVATLFENSSEGAQAAELLRKWGAK